MGTNNEAKSISLDNIGVNKIGDFTSSNFFHVYNNKLVNITGNSIQLEKIVIKSITVINYLAQDVILSQ